MNTLRRFSYGLPRVGVYWFQYGIWDLRVHCLCGKLESFFGSAERDLSLNEHGQYVFTPQQPCLACGESGPFILEDLTKCDLDELDYMLKARLTSLVQPDPS